jgi:hypothetical protein
MLSSYDITRALVADHQSTLRHEARQLRMGRLARRVRSRRAVRAEQPATPDAQTLRPVPAAQELPPAAALAAWQHDQRAA